MVITKVNNSLRYNTVLILVSFSQKMRPHPFKIIRNYSFDLRNCTLRLNASTLIEKRKCQMRDNAEYICFIHQTKKERPTDVDFLNGFCSISVSEAGIRTTSGEGGGGEQKMRPTAASCIRVVSTSGPSGSPDRTTSGSSADCKGC